MGLAPAALTRMTADLAWGQSGPGRDALSQPEDIAPAVLYMVSDLAADHTGKVPGVSHARVLEVKMLHTGGFTLGRPFTAEDLAAHAGQIYFPR